MHSSVRVFLLSLYASFVGKKKKKKLGKLLHYVCFGPSKGREIWEPSITMKAWTKQLKIISWIIFGIGLDCSLGTLFGVVRIFGLVRLFLGCGCWFLCLHALLFGLWVALYTSCMLLFALHFSLTHKKKKWS